MFAIAFATAARAAPWPLWESYCRAFMDPQGRVIDHHAGGRSTSEGQAYALFFALVANDRSRFQRVLEWTENHLAQGGLAKRLPAWLWGKSSAGEWGVVDENSASDADVWLAYTLLEAGRLWNDPELWRKGEALAALVARQETADLPGLGCMLLPAPRGFHPDQDVWQLNPSYLALQLFLRLAALQPSGPWAGIARNTPEVVRGSAPAGFVMDWSAWRVRAGFGFGPLPYGEASGSYDAIRVYLWAGMLHPKTPGRRALLDALSGMRAHLRHAAIPPVAVTAQGVVKNPAGGPGFSAAVIPFLAALREDAALNAQRRRLSAERDAATGLYGKDPRYYDQNLALFATGWSEKRFFFGPHGDLKVDWRKFR